MGQTGVYAEQGGGGGTGILYIADQNNVQSGPDASNTIYLQGEDPIYTVADPGTFSIEIRKRSNYKWVTHTSSGLPDAFETDFAYITKGSTAAIFQLPASAAVGDTYKIVGYGNLWKVQQNALQKIVLGNIQTTAGVSGYVQATVITDQIEIVCVTANTEFYVIAVQGNPTFN